MERSDWSSGHSVRLSHSTLVSVEVFWRTLSYSCSYKHVRAVNCTVVQGVGSSVPCKREVVCQRVVDGGVETVVVDKARDVPPDFRHGKAVVELLDHLVDVHFPVAGA